MKEIGMYKISFSRTRLVLLLCLSFVSTMVCPSLAVNASQRSLTDLQALLKSQYAAVEEEIYQPPDGRGFPGPEEYRVALRAWQARLASKFADAAATVEEIIKVDPANTEMWRERLETLRLYSQPISPPSQRTVFGQSEVNKKAKILDAPAAVYTDEARADGIKGEVRLRLVLAADGTVKYVFPIRSMDHGLTESAMAAARQIKFEPAVRGSAPVSQFATFVYDFRKKNATPHIPIMVF